VCLVPFPVVAYVFNESPKGLALTRARKYLLRGLGIIVGIFVLFWIGMYGFFMIKKEAIRQQLSAEIGEAVKGEFIVKDIGMNFFNLFPNVSLSMRQVEMRDSTWAVHKQSLLKADKILLRINPFSLIGGNVRISKLVIEDAVINMFADTSGYTNEYLFSPKTAKAKNNKKGFHLEEIALKNVRIIRSDQKKQKLYDFSFRKFKGELSEQGNGLEMEIKMDGTIHSLAFNVTRGSYAREKSIEGNFDIKFDKNKKQLSFDNIKLRIDKHPYLLTGLFDFSELKDFRIAIKANKIQYQKAITVLPLKIADKLSLYSVSQPLDVNAQISGKMLFGNLPKVTVDVKAGPGTVKTPVGDFSELSFNGNFSNAAIDSLPYVDENSMLTFLDLKGKYEGIPISSKKLTISNLINPFLRCDLRAEAQLAALNNLLGSASFDFIGGVATADLNYAGALMSDTSTSISGYVKLDNGTLIYQPRNVKLTNIEGRLVFDKEDLFIRDFTAEAQSNKVKIDAVVKNMVNLLVNDPSKLFIDADINIPSLDLFAFKSMLGVRKKKSVTTKGKFSKLAEKIDRFMDDCSIASRVHAGSVKYKNFVAKDLDASFSMNANKWDLKKIALKNSDGVFNLQGTLTAVNENNNTVSIDADMVNVNISKLFAAFDNFGMPSLHAENIRGILTSKTHLNAVLDDESRLITNSLTGSMDLSLRNGELVNFDPLQKMAVFVLKKRDFSKVEFAEIKNTFEINGKILTINKMEIQSNILGLFVEGIYDLQGKSTDLVVQVPLKYLKKREPGYVPENQGLDAKTGISVYVRAKNGDNGDIDFKYGLFKKRSVLEKEEKEVRKSTTSIQR